jgi:DNA-binding transcriptional LysR family regulator
MINLNHLKYFYDVCQSGSLTLSAKKNLVSHSAISQAIRNLELYYDVNLMIHKKNGFEITEEGKVLFDNIQPVFDSVKLSKIKLEDLRNEVSGELSLGFSYSMAMSFMPDLIKKLKNKHPKIKTSVKLANSFELKELILNREIDIGLGIDDGSFFQLESKLIKKGKFVLVSSKNEFDLKNETFLIGDKGDEVNKFKHFYQKNRLTNQIIEITSWEVIFRFIQSGLGIGLVPDFILDTALFKKNYIVELDLKLPTYELKYFFREEKYLSRNSRVFLDL